MMRPIPLASCLAALSLITGHAVAQAPPLQDRILILGEVAPKSAAEIADNNWSIGTETIDRDFSTHAAWRDYLGPLGAKHARLQSGWARTDAGGGVYDFAWLDPIVDDIIAQGVTPWMSLGYGNPAYIGGGTPQRDTDLPEGEGRAAWLAYVHALVTRYRGRIDAWELWNEPDLIEKFTAEEFGRFAAETARVVKEADPEAYVIVAGYTGLGDHSRTYVVKSLEAFAAEGDPALADAVIFHAYAPNPDSIYASVEPFRDAIQAVIPDLELRQGESGAPSLNQQTFALRNIWWTEESQAKFLLRRMLGDAAHRIPTSVFTLTDLHYPAAIETAASFAASSSQRSAVFTMNTKGLLETRRYAPGTPDEDRTVVRMKVGYRAMQSVTSIFDSRLQPVDGACTASAAGVSAYAFKRDDGALVVAAWRSTDRPGEQVQHQDVDISCTGVTFAGETTYVDLLTSSAYRVLDLVRLTSDGVTLTAVPVYDSPVLVADRSLVEIW